MYTIGDFLIQLKNAYMAGKPTISFPYSKAVLAIAKVLKEEGYIQNVKSKTEDEKKSIEIELLYKGRKPVVHDIRLVSKPSVRRYVAKNRIPRTEGGFGIAILSTSSGIMTGKKARKEKIGGEIICQIY